MIKITAKKETLKGVIKGDSDTVALELVHISVKLVKHLISIDKAVGYAAGATIIEVLQKIVPEKPKKDESQEDQEEQAEAGGKE